jgi:predicted RecB family endonuclease
LITKLLPVDYMQAVLEDYMQVVTEDYKQVVIEDCMQVVECMVEDRERIEEMLVE